MKYLINDAPITSSRITEIIFPPLIIITSDEKFMKAYRWMVEQMKQRIGEPPINDIKFPIWAWYQYNSAKSKKPPRSYLDIQEGLSAYMEIEIPDNEVLLSDFMNWHNVLSQIPLTDWKKSIRKLIYWRRKLAKVLDLKIILQRYKRRLKRVGRLYLT